MDLARAQFKALAGLFWNQFLKISYKYVKKAVTKHLSLCFNLPVANMSKSCPVMCLFIGSGDILLRSLYQQRDVHPNGTSLVLLFLVQTAGRAAAIAWTLWTSFTAPPPPRSPGLRSASEY